MTTRRTHTHVTSPAQAVVWALILLVCTRSAEAQPASSPGVSAPSTTVSLTVADAVSRALDSSARLREVQARQASQDAQVMGARAADAPLVTWLGGFSRTNNIDEFGVPQPDGRLRVIFPNVPTNYQSRLDAQWPVYTSGRLQALERSAAADGAALRFDERTLRADLSLEVTRVYWSIVQGTFVSGVLSRSLGRLNTHEMDVRARLEAGIVPPSDVMAIAARQASEEGAYLDSQMRVRQQQLLLAHLIGVPLDTPLVLTEPLPESLVGPDPDAPSFSGAPPPSPRPPGAIAPQTNTVDGTTVPPDSAGPTARPELRALNARVDAATARADAAAREHRPLFSVVGGVDWARPNSRRFPREDTWQHSWDVGVQASWPLFDAGRADARRAAAEANANALREQRADMAARFSLEVAQRRVEVESMRRRFDTTMHGVLAARENQRVVRARFAAGVATNADVLDAEVEWMRAELDRVQAFVNMRLAEAYLARATAQ